MSQQKTQHPLETAGSMSMESFSQSLERIQRELDLGCRLHRTKANGDMVTSSLEEAQEITIQLVEVNKDTIAAIQAIKKLRASVDNVKATDATPVPFDEPKPIVPGNGIDALGQIEDEDHHQTPANMSPPPKEATTVSSDHPPDKHEKMEEDVEYPKAPYNPRPVLEIPKIPNLLRPELSPRTKILANNCRLSTIPRQKNGHRLDPFLRDGDFIFHLFLRRDLISSTTIYQILDREWFHGKFYVTYRKKDIGATTLKLKNAGLLASPTDVDKTSLLFVTEKGKELLAQFHPNEYDTYKKEPQVTPEFTMTAKQDAGVASILDEVDDINPPG